MNQPTVLENLFVTREKLDLAAVYFLQPTRDSVKQLVHDFSHRKPQYGLVHLFFTAHVQPEEVKLIASCPSLKKRLRTFTELNTDFVAIEKSVFTHGIDPHIQGIYWPKSKDALAAELSIISARVTSVLLTLNEYPLIRYWAKGKAAMCEALAKFIDSDMQHVVAKQPTWKHNEDRERGTLLIVDRSIDPVAPLMHEYTYQAMVNDLLDVAGELIKLDIQRSESQQSSSGGGRRNRDDDGQVVLSEEDDLWVNFRHEHIGKVMGDISAKFREFKGSNKMAQLQSDQSGNASVKDMIHAMKAMPTYKAMMKKYHKHMSIAQACMDKFDKHALKPLGELEQDMATGLTSEGSAINLKQLKGRLIDMCNNPNVTVLDKLRLLMIYIISQGGIQDSTRRELMKNVDTRLQRAIRNLEGLGVDLNTAGRKGNSKHSKARLAEFAKRNKTIPMALMRYIPILHSVLTKFATGALSEDDFPYVHRPGSGDAPQDRRQAASVRNWRSNEVKDTSPRKFVFVLGGASFSELRSAYEVAEATKTNIIMGSGTTLTAKTYIKNLSRLSDSEFRDALAGRGGSFGGADDDSWGAGSLDIDFKET